MNNLTKIISTLGPAINNEKTLLSIVQKGTNAFRINFSHGSFNEHLKSIKMIRGIENKLNLSIPIIGDLQGPKFRIGTLTKDRQVSKKDKINFYFEDDDLSQENVVLLPHVGSATASTRLAMVGRALENLHAGMAGQTLPYCANPEVYLISGS